MHACPWSAIASLNLCKIGLLAQQFCALLCSAEAACLGRMQVRTAGAQAQQQGSTGQQPNIQRQSHQRRGQVPLQQPSATQLADNAQQQHAARLQHSSGAIGTAQPATASDVAIQQQADRPLPNLQQALQQQTGTASQHAGDRSEHRQHQQPALLKRTSRGGAVHMVPPLQEGPQQVQTKDGPMQTLFPWLYKHANDSAKEGSSHAGSQHRRRSFGRSRSRSTVQVSM